MSEFPGFQPWHVGGDEGYTYAELDELAYELKRRQEHRQKQSAKTPRPGRRSRWR